MQGTRLIFGLFGILCALAGCREARQSSAREDAPRVSDAAWRTWRIEAKNATVQFAGAFADKARTWRVSFAGSEKTPQGGRVVLAAQSLRAMLGSWIPPYVGLRAKRIRLSVYPLARKNCVPQFRYSTSPRQRRDWTADDALWKTLPEGCWTELVYDVVLQQGQRLGELAFVLPGREGASCEFLFADVRVELDGGDVYEVLNPEAPSYRTGMKEPLRRTPLRPVPTRPKIQFGTQAGWYATRWRDMAAIGGYMARYLPEYDIVFSLDGTPEPAFAFTMANVPGNVFFQFQKGQHDLRYARLADALVKNPKGEMQPFKFNSCVATHPLLRDAYEDQIAYAGSLGFNSVQQYDYVWFYPDGPWGFDAATTARFREDLSETDEGLRLGPSRTEGAKTIRFGDYYAAYNGRRLSPADCGLTDWRDFVPRFGTAEEKALHWTLVSYEWLKLAQNFGAWTRRHGFGTPFEFLLNGEAPESGNDHVFVQRLADVGMISPEFFIATPKRLEALFCGLGRYIREARRYGKPIGLTVETSTGGGGTQAYWSPRTGYAISYFLSAMGLDGFEYDHLMDFEHPFASYIDGKHPGQWKIWALGLADARGYRQAKLDGAVRRKPTGVWHLAERGVARCGRPGFLFDTDPAGPGEDFRMELRAHGLDYEMTDPQELPEILSEAKVVFVSPFVTRRDTRDLLDAWAKADAAHVLVTERGTVGAVAARLGLPRVQRATSGRPSAVAATFDAKVGHVAVLVNRAASEAAKTSEWNRKARAVFHKETWSPDGLLYRDTCPGADVAAEVPVADAGTYRIYRFVADVESTAESRDGGLALTLGDGFSDVFYYGRDTPAFRAFLDGVKRERAVTAEFFR